MLILEKELNLDRTDNKTHKKLNFSLDKNYNKIIIEFNYFPRDIKNNIAKKDIVKCLKLYKGTDDIKEVIKEAETIELKNFIVVSIKKEDEFIGVRHYNNNMQKIEISKYSSTKGYINFEPIAGEYSVILSCHLIYENVNAKVKVSVND